MANEGTRMSVYKTFDDYLKRFFPEAFAKQHAPKDPAEQARIVVEKAFRRWPEGLVVKKKAQ